MLHSGSGYLTDFLKLQLKGMSYRITNLLLPSLLLTIVFCEGCKKPNNEGNSTIKVTTFVPSEITAISATCGGRIFSADGSYLPIMMRGICWGEETNPTLNDHYKQFDNGGIGEFSGTINGLKTNTTYYIRAFAVTADETFFGEEQRLTTRNGIPIISTTEVSTIGFNWALGGGIVTDDGGLIINELGICWGTEPNPTINNNHQATSTIGTGLFSVYMTNLSPNSIYHVRAYATNDQGTTYGEDESFTINSHYVSNEPSYRNVILEEFSGRTCPWCPDGHVVANEILSAHLGRVFSVAYHAVSSLSPTTYPNLNTSISATIDAGFNCISLPSAVINRSTASVIGRNQWAALTNTQLAQAAECNVGGTVIVNSATRVATITVEVYYTGNSSEGENYLSIAMTQDSILGSQSGSSSNPGQMINGQYVHQHVFRDMITSTWGDVISPTTQGTLITKTYEYQIPESIGSPNGVEVVLEHIHFIAFVTERYQGTPTRPILNANELETIVWN